MVCVDTEAADVLGRHKTLYHVSETGGLTELNPHVSAHGKAYVYAVEHVTLGLLFGARHDDFDFILDVGDNGIPGVYECYPDAFKAVYKDKSCSVYEVSGAGFQTGRTPWSPELVCEDVVPVLREVKVSDLYDRLLQEVNHGTLVLHCFDPHEEYKQLISKHIIDRLIRFDALDRLERDPRFQRYYRRIIEALRYAMDGHLL